jgi:hypothetical protein
LPAWYVLSHILNDVSFIIISKCGYFIIQWFLGPVLLSNRSTLMGCAENFRPWSFSTCGKDSDNLLLLFNIVLSFVFNDPVKTFHPGEEDGLEAFECLIFPDCCHDLQPSETANCSSCASTFQKPEVTGFSSSE